jgi:hypothetical protein
MQTPLAERSTNMRILFCLSFAQTKELGAKHPQIN